MDLLGEGGVGGSSVILTFGSLRFGAWAGRAIVYPGLPMVLFEYFFFIVSLLSSRLIRRFCNSFLIFIFGFKPRKL